MSAKDGIAVIFHFLKGDYYDHEELYAKERRLFYPIYSVDYIDETSCCELIKPFCSYKTNRVKI